LNITNPGQRSGKTVVTAVHAASVMLDKAATTAKACRLIEQAASAGSRFVVFPESFLPGFPLWNALIRPIDGHAMFRRFAENSIRIDGAELREIADAAARHRIIVSMGISEVSAHSEGCLWNSNVLISERGELLNHHRKLVPTFYEKLSWSAGDGAGLQVVATNIGRIGSLICGENNNPLSRYTLMAQGEQIHTANYPPVWPFRNPLGAARYDLSDAIRVRAAAHSFEAKTFTIVSAGFLDEASLAALADGNAESEAILKACPRSCSMIVGPDGSLRSELRSEEEGMVHAEIDVSEVLEHKQHHDMAGYYNRMDIYALHVQRARPRPAYFSDDLSLGEESVFGNSSDQNFSQTNGNSKETNSTSQNGWRRGGRLP
jgi:aliphatic nitrilase